jgi:hypothetical protein
VIAGTNAGKTAPVVLSLFVASPGRNSTVLLLSLLKLLQAKRVSTFSRLVIGSTTGFKTVVVNGDTRIK